MLKKDRDYICKAIHELGQYETTEDMRLLLDDMSRLEMDLDVMIVRQYGGKALHPNLVKLRRGHFYFRQVRKGREEEEGLGASE